MYWPESDTFPAELSGWKDLGWNVGYLFVYGTVRRYTNARIRGNTIFLRSF